jgi:histidine triad (HIT) family protein
MEVPHAHLHLVPINAEHELSFANTPLSVSSEEMVALAQAISAGLDSAE